MAVYQDKDKNGKVIKTKDGRSWYFRCYYVNVYGIKKQKKSKKFFGKHEAEEAERKFLLKVNTIDTTSSGVMFKDVYDEWLTVKKSQVKETTYYARKKRGDRHILSYFEKYKLHSIKINVVNMWRDKILNLNTMDTDYKNRLITDFKEILDYAVGNYGFNIKIASKLQKVRVEKVINQTDAQVNFWTFDEFKKFISVVNDQYYYIMFNFFYYTGLRIGEANALNWHDIDFKKKTLRINKTLSFKVFGQTYVITTPKTKNSIRIIDLDDNLIVLLKELQNTQKQIYGYSDDWFIFGDVNPFAPTTFKRYLDDYIKLTKVKRITPHGFRHSHVSLLINLGCDSRDVAERIGDTVQMVEKTYYHMFPSKKTHVINVLNKLK